MTSRAKETLRLRRGGADVKQETHGEDMLITKVKLKGYTKTSPAKHTRYKASVDIFPFRYLRKTNRA